MWHSTNHTSSANRIGTAGFELNSILRFNITTLGIMNQRESCPNEFSISKRIGTPICLFIIRETGRTYRRSKFGTHITQLNILYYPLRTEQYVGKKVKVSVARIRVGLINCDLPTHLLNPEFHLWPPPGRLRFAFLLIFFSGFFAGRSSPFRPRHKSPINLKEYFISYVSRAKNVGEKIHGEIIFHIGDIYDWVLWTLGNRKSTHTGSQTVDNNRKAFSTESYMVFYRSFVVRFVEMWNWKNCSRNQLGILKLSLSIIFNKTCTVKPQYNRQSIWINIFFLNILLII